MLKLVVNNDVLDPGTKFYLRTHQVSRFKFQDALNFLRGNGTRPTLLPNEVADLRTKMYEAGGRKLTEEEARQTLLQMGWWYR